MSRPMSGAASLQRANPVFLALVSAFLLGSTAWIGTPYMTGATASYLLMVWGVFFVKDRMRHGMIMTAAVALDLAIVFVLQFAREAVQTAASLSLTPLQLAHVAASLIATALYVPVILMGIKRLQGRRSGAALLHRKLGMAAFLFRTAGYFLMFSMLQKS